MERTNRAGSEFEIEKNTTRLREDSSEEIEIIPVVKKTTANTRNAISALFGARKINMAKAVATPFPPLNFKYGL